MSEVIRFTREEYFTDVLHLTAQRSTCLRGQVASLLVRDKRIVGQGYNGAPPGQPECLEVGCDVPEEPIPLPIEQPQSGCIRTVHAEANAIAFAARHGISTEGCEMWSTHSPCLDCAKLMLSAGIVKLTYLEEYRLGRVDILDDAGIEVVFLG